MTTKKTLFNEDWVNPQINLEWSRIFGAVKGDVYMAYCKLCKKSFSLSNMGKQALASHEKGSGHKRKVEAMKTTPNAAAYFKKNVNSIQNSHQDVEESPSSSNTVVNRQIFSFDMEKVLESEILWALHSVETHMSDNSVNKTTPLLKKMFPDSKIADKMRLGSNKLKYLTVFGLAPYFDEELVEQVLKCNYFVACFDESLNRISQRGQMDIIVRFWDNAKGKVATRLVGTPNFFHLATNLLCSQFQ